MSQKTNQILNNYIKTKKGINTEHLNKETKEPLPI